MVRKQPLSHIYDIGRDTSDNGGEGPKEYELESDPVPYIGIFALIATVCAGALVLGLVADALVAVLFWTWVVLAVVLAIWLVVGLMGFLPEKNSFGSLVGTVVFVGLCAVAAVSLVLWVVIGNQSF